MFDQPALPPGSRSIEHAIYVDAVATIAIPITRDRIPRKQQPAATPRLVALRSPRRRLVAVKSDRPVNRRWASEAIVRFDYGEIGKGASRGGRGRVVG